MSSEAAMLKGLRRKFVLLIVGIAALVVVAAFSAVCYVDHRQAEDDVYGLLEQTLQEAERPLRGQGYGALRNGGEGEGAGNGDGQQDARPEAPRIGGRAGGSSSLPVAAYYVESSGLLAFALPLSSAEIGDDVLQSALEAVDGTALMQDGSARQGKLADLGLYYAAQPLPFGFAIAFADASSVSWQPLAGILAIVGILVILAVLGIAILFSRWALRPVQQAWDRQQRFIADASHELKTPLTVILANASILESHPDSTVADQRQWISSTQMEAHRMQGLVEELLQLARFDQAVEAPQEQVDLSDLAEREALAFEPVAFERQLSLDVDIQPGLALSANREQLERLCAILLDNACKHGAPGTAITVRLTREGAWARLAVANRGPAIPAEDLPRIFDRFYQADRSRSEEGAGGFGLGLSIAREIMQGMGGDLTAASSEAAGTEFTARIPLAGNRRKDSRARE